MEFVKYDEVVEALNDMGIDEEPFGEKCTRLALSAVDDAEPVHLHLADDAAETEPVEGAQTVSIEKQRLPGVVEHMLHLLHLNDVLLVPLSKWRAVFDAVAFSMASNEDWQEMDATATVRLNTRDPLLCQPGDWHLIVALVEALLSDGETVEQGLIITSTAAPVVAELLPEGILRIAVGNQVLADEISECMS